MMLITCPFFLSLFSRRHPLVPPEAILISKGGKKSRESWIEKRIDREIVKERERDVVWREEGKGELILVSK